MADPVCVRCGASGSIVEVNSVDVTYGVDVEIGEDGAVRYDSDGMGGEVAWDSGELKFFECGSCGMQAKDLDTLVVDAREWRKWHEKEFLVTVGNQQMTVRALDEAEARSKAWSIYEGDITVEEVSDEGRDDTGAGGGVGAGADAAAESDRAAAEEAGGVGFDSEDLPEL